MEMENDRVACVRTRDELLDPTRLVFPLHWNTAECYRPVLYVDGHSWAQPVPKRPARKYAESLGYLLNPSFLSTYTIPKYLE
jgi:hypothetical protein